MTTPAVPITTSWRQRPASPATSSVVTQPSGTLSSSSRRRACGAAVGDSIRSAVASPANPSYKDGSDRVATIAESRSTTPSRSRCSASVHGRASAISTSTGANPAIPAYSESRSAGRSGRLPSGLHRPGQPGALVVAHVVQHPGPGLLTDLPVLLRRGHQLSLNIHDGAPVGMEVEVTRRRGRRLHSQSPTAGPTGRPRRRLRPARRPRAWCGCWRRGDARYGCSG